MLSSPYGKHTYSVSLFPSKHFFIVMIGQANFDQDSLNTTIYMLWAYFIYEFFSQNVSLHVCAWAASYQLNSLEICTARVLCSSCTFRFFVFHILTRCYSIVCQLIRTNFYGTNMHDEKNLCFFGLVLPRKYTNVFSYLRQE